jgi:hypothetical protein
MTVASSVQRLPAERQRSLHAVLKCRHFERALLRIRLRELTLG